MSTMRTPARPFLTALLAAALTTAVQAAPPSSAKDALLPGAKLIHRFTKEVYRVPALVTTDKGPRLEIWFDEFDPEPPQRISGIPNPDPRMDLLIWDPMANKEQYKLSYPKDPIAYPSVYTGLVWSGWMALSPDGKQLATRTVNYTPRRGSPYGDFTTQVRLIDLGSGKARQVAEYREERAPGAVQVYLLFAPDGSLVTIRGTTCTVRETGKDKPRMSFEIPRADYKMKAYWFSIHQAVVSPDGSQLAIAADGTILVYDLATGKKLFAAARAAPEPKTSNDPMSGALSLVYAPSATDPKLLAVEWVAGAKGAPKNYVLTRAFDLKDKKEVSSWKVEGHQYPVSAYYTAQGEPRVVYDGKILDGATGKELHRFDFGAGAFVSPDGKALVRLLRPNKNDKRYVVELWSLEGEQ